MFPINPVDILLSPKKYGLKAFCLAALIILPYFFFTIFAAKRNQRKSAETGISDQLDTEEVAERAEENWQKTAEEIDEERSKGS